MIRNKYDLKEYIYRDSLANGRTTVRTKILGDEVWKFHVALRKLEYYSNLTPTAKLLNIPFYMLSKLKFKRLCVKLCFTIPINVFDKGLSIVHQGTVVVSEGASVGENCRIQEGVNIGATNGSAKAATIGKNVFIGTGAKIIGKIEIADDVAIGANAVVVKSISEPGTTWAGVPAKKISDNNSHSNLSKSLF